MEGFNSRNNPVDTAVDVELRGRIQGVGFRPFLYRLAMENGVSGWVRNCTAGVQLHLEAPENVINRYLKEISSKAPAAARITSIRAMASKSEGCRTFSIISSSNNNGKGSGKQESAGEIPPDFAVCGECLEDMKEEGRRSGYLFTNCTNCGPRFSIIRGLPYDRDKTTMSSFEMCGDCRKEYEDVLNRRFHAQPVSCRNCGPEYTLHTESRIIKDSRAILLETGKIIKNGGIAAVKGTGGFHLACDPFNEEAVARLRRLKNRDGKPFAVMFSGIEAIRRHCSVSSTEEQILTSVETPIVLLSQLKTSSVCREVNRGLGTLGCFLPYTPFHHMFFKLTGLEAVVLTSANPSGSPIVKDNETALDLFRESCEAVVVYNREIYNRCDDSVGRVTGEKFTMIRRSRGYVPESIPIGINVDSILAAGGELKNTFCMGLNKKAVLSQHIGNLENPETYDFYRKNIERFKDLFRFTPKLIVHDMHPGYRSTVYAKEQAESRGIPVLAVQHHHAHIASCMAENGIDSPVIGFSFDGTGLGDDGNIWGGEVFVCDLGSYKRMFHLQYTGLPGGDSAVYEPWKTAAAMLYGIYGQDFTELPLAFLRDTDSSKLGMIMKMTDKSINTPLTSSAGRLFDAAAAIMGLCVHASFEAEGPMRMETLTVNSIPDYYPMPLNRKKGTIGTSDIIAGMVDDITEKVPDRIISTKFHNSVIRMILEVARNLRDITGINTAALSGGVFLNRYLMEGCVKLLTENGFRVITHSKVSPGDGGLALGQLAAGAEILTRGGISCV